MSNLKGTLQDASGNYLLPIPSDSCPIEESSTASQAYAVNDLFYYNNTLYKCTVAMVQGDTITPGTNCTATTTGGELSQLNSSLSGIDIRYESATGAPEWSPRGADTWSPFKSEANYIFGFVGFLAGITDTICFDYIKNGDSYTYQQIMTNRTINNDYATISIVNNNITTIFKQEGMVVVQGNTTPSYFHAGDTYNTRAPHIIIFQ